MIRLSDVEAAIVDDIRLTMEEDDNPRVESRIVELEDDELFEFMEA